MADESSPLLQALIDHRVKAEVIDLDHYRIRGGMAVETDYIIAVEPTQEPSKKTPQIQAFLLSKTFSTFRTLAGQLKKSSDNLAQSKNPDHLPKSVKELAQYCDSMFQLAESQRQEYLGKVNFGYVKTLAKKRRQIIKDMLESTLAHFPTDVKVHPFQSEVAQTIETFFLLDHCEEADDENTGLKRYSKNEDDEDSDKPSTFFEKRKGSVESAVGRVNEKVGKILGKNTNQSAPLKVDTNAVDAVNSLTSPVVPFTRKNRRSVMIREQDQSELSQVGNEAKLLMDDDRPPTELVPSYSHPVPSFQSRGSAIGNLLEGNPVIFAGIAAATVVMLKYAGKLSATVDLDILMLLIWASFCIGLHTPRPMVGGVDRSVRPPMSGTPRRRTSDRRRNMMNSMRKDHDGRRLLRMSLATPTSESQREMMSDKMIEIEEEEELPEVNQSPLPRFPEGAPLGSKNNCWSEPIPERFQVRGANYLKDKVKVGSGPFIFPVRGVDLFLTDTCPENAGSNPGVMGGMLRDKPTFIVNFRLPWGILLSYFEIPERFLPFMRAGHEPDFDKSTLPSMDSMPPGDRCAARFLMAPAAKKNETLKIVPVLVEGPWVVRSVVGGKPALIGNKLPVNYCYQKAEGDKAAYLEADLDIVASSAARGILSVTRTYTQVLTLDLGFVVQGNSTDELPEQMLIGARLHSLDPLTAPPYPTYKDMPVPACITDDEEADD